jgi:hypothetical protein
MARIPASTSHDRPARSQRYHGVASMRHGADTEAHLTRSSGLDHRHQGRAALPSLAAGGSETPCQVHDVFTFLWHMVVQRIGIDEQLNQAIVQLSDTIRWSAGSAAERTRALAPPGGRLRCQYVNRSRSTRSLNHPQAFRHKGRATHVAASGLLTWRRPLDSSADGRDANDVRGP